MISPDAMIAAAGDPLVSSLVMDDQNIIPEVNPAQINSNLFNLSLTIGAGIEFAISGKTAILAGIVFNNGFVNILDYGDEEKTVLRNLGLRSGLLF